MNGNPLIDPVWAVDNQGDLWLYPVGVTRKGMGRAVGNVSADPGYWFAWTKIHENGMTSGGENGCESDVKTAKAACEQALRNAGYRFADDPPRGSMEEKPITVGGWNARDDRSVDLLYENGDIAALVAPRIHEGEAALVIWAPGDQVNPVHDLLVLGISTEYAVSTARTRAVELLGEIGVSVACRGSMTRGLPLADELDPASYLPAAIAALHDVLRVGAERYPDEKWKTQNVAEHLRHAREHIRLHTIGDDSEPHLRHALTRLAFAVEIAEGGAK